MLRSTEPCSFSQHNILTFHDSLQRRCEANGSASPPPPFHLRATDGRCISSHVAFHAKKDGQILQKLCSRGDLAAIFFSFSFLSPLLSLPNTENLNEEKSLIFHKRIKIVNVCGSIGKMGKDFYLFFCSESLFFLLCFLHLERAFKHLEY